MKTSELTMFALCVSAILGIIVWAVCREVAHPCLRYEERPSVVTTCVPIGGVNVCTSHPTTENICVQRSR